MTKNINPEHKQPRHKQSFFRSLNTDIIWPIVAIGLLFGVVLFYFDGLQPLILSKYINSSKNAVNKLNNSLILQTNQFRVVESAVFNQIKYFNPSETCSASQITDTTVVEFSDLVDYKSKLLPDETLQNLPRYSVFYVPAIETKYTELYKQYEATLEQYNKSYKQSLTIADYLNYRNLWIESCSKIQLTKGKLTDLKGLCSTLVNTKKEFTELGYYPETAKLTDISATKCGEVINFVEKPANRGVFPNFSKWFLDWYTGFQNLMTYNIDTTQLLSEPQSASNEFSSYYSSALQHIDEYKSSKETTLESKFYLIDFEL